ncbi:MAG: deoxycytidine triphosphate deaminase [Patescibacteria group bacterium]
MLLSRDQILKHLKKGTIIIDPFNDKQLKTTSYDVTLGEWYWKEAHPAGRSTIHNLYDEESTARVWQGPFEAEPVSALLDKLGVDFKNIGKNSRVILLGPQETILAHTREFIGGRDIVVSKMYARSSLGRNFVEVCKDAGWGDVGYFNRWTMEATNNSQHYTIPLVVGRRIAQIVFYEVAPLEKSGVDYVSEGGKYQSSKELDELKRTWNPQMMLPRMHLDWEVKE